MYKIRFQGLQACAFSGVIGEALLIYSKDGSQKQDAEVEIANLFEHSEKRPHISKSYESVSNYVSMNTICWYL